MMLAVLSDTGWWVIGGIVTIVVKEVLDWVKTWLKDRADERRARILKAATEAAAVKLATVTETSAKKVTDHLLNQDEAIEVIRKENNGAKEQLVAEVRKAAFAKGVKSETDKQTGHEFQLDPGETPIVIKGTLTTEEHKKEG